MSDNQQHDPNVPLIDGGTPATANHALSDRAASVEFRYAEPYRSEGPQGVGPIDAAKSTSVLATAYRASHDPRPVDVVDAKTMVRVPSDAGRMIEMTAQQAVELGRLVRNDDGTYRDVNAEDVQAVTAANEQRAADAPATINDVWIDGSTNAKFFSHAEASLNAVGHRLEDVVKDALAGDADSSALYAAATHAGVDAPGAVTALNKILQGIVDKSTKALVDYGVLPANQIEEFIRWTDEPQNRNHSLNAVMEIVRSGRITTIKAMAERFSQGAYKRRVQSPDSPESAGWERYSRNGVDYVTIPGKGTMKYRTAKLERLL